MKSHRVYGVVCRICHKRFSSHSFKACYCSKECKNIAERMRNKVRYRKNNPLPSNSGRSLDNNYAIRDIANEAHELNMTYGQYVAKMEEINGLY